MKLEMPELTIEKSADFKRNSFGIGNQAVIMNILRSKMYNNPIKTVCQEYISNARDAHREAGKESIAIDVTIPTENEPFYKVRDFGPGITPDRMINVFLLYGNSTKRSDNTQTGGFGLGAKSAFALGTSFSIESITDSVKRTYVAFIGQDDLGELNLISEEPTEEFQGTTIIIPANPDDAEKFDKYSHLCTQYWDVRPNFLNSTHSYDTVHKVFEYTITNSPDCTTNKIDVIKYNDYGTKVKAVIDGIPYPVKSDVIDFNSLEGAGLAFKERCWILHFNCGEITVSANRDDIEYTDASKDKILNLLKEGIHQFIKALLDKVPNAPTLKAAYEALKNIKDSYGYYPPKDLAWQGYTINKNGTIPLEGMVYSFSGKAISRKHGMCHAVHLLGSTVVVFNDINADKIPRNRIKTLFAQGHSSVQMINHWNGTTPEERLISKNRANQIYGFNNVEVINISTIPPTKDIRAPRGKKPQVIRTLKNVDAVHRFNWRYIWEEAQGDVSSLTDGAYVVSTGMSIKLNGKTLNENYEFKKLFALKKQLDLTNLYCINEKDVPKLNKSMKPLEDLINEKVYEYVKVNAKTINLSIQNSFYENFDRLHLLLEDKYRGMILNQKGIAYTYTKFKEIRAHNDDGISLLSQYTSVSIPSKDSAKTKKMDLSKLYKRFVEKYPMLTMLNQYHDVGEESIMHIIEYINLKDSQ